MTDQNAKPLQERSASQLRLQPMQLWIGYAQTPGLDSYRKAERYSAWWHTHCQLKKRDANYTSECRRFHVQVGFSVMLAVALFSGLISGFSLPLALLLSVTAAGSATFLFCASEQRRRNDWIGRQFVAEPISVE